MACSGDPVAKESGQRPPELATDLEGLPITHIEVSGNRRLPTEGILIAMCLKAGEPLSHDAIAKAIRTIYSGGQIDDVEVFATHEGAGVALTVVVRERMPIAEIFAPGIPEQSKDEMAKWIGLEKGKPFDVADVAVQRRTIADGMAHRGAKLDVRTHVLASGELDLCILVQQ
jgi:outer membrane protein assembly factor BamA